jgi:hypothetical protein
MVCLSVRRISISYCQATTREGQPCRAHHVKGSPYCFWHAPHLERRRKWAAHMGGLATLEDRRKRRDEREGRLKTLRALEQALAVARQLYGFNK